MALWLWEMISGSYCERTAGQRSFSRQNRSYPYRGRWAVFVQDDEQLHHVFLVGRRQAEKPAIV